MVTRVIWTLFEQIASSSQMLQWIMGQSFTRIKAIERKTPNINKARTKLSQSAETSL